MYKVFFNRVALTLVENGSKSIENSDSPNPEFVTSDQVHVEQFEKWITEPEKQVFLVVDELEKSWKIFQKNFKRVEACGGLVINAQEELLCIYRNGYWDLPKGKLESGEIYSECALREVEEETGVQAKLFHSQVFWTTYHVYFHKKKWVLKPTYWFKMKAVKSKDLTPQLEEGIVEVDWMNSQKLQTTFLKNTYRSIHEMMDQTGVY
jgi:8-oxo-dGTP pyrophosphatase MutT (NUDIX family)